MKKTKTFTAWILALCFTFSATAMQACSQKPGNADDFPPSSDSTEISDSVSPPEENGGETDDAETGTGTETRPTPDPQPEPIPEPEPEPQITYAQYIRCTGDSVNLRAGAGTGYSVLGTAEKGTTYAVVGKSGQWYKTYYRGKTAYLYASYAAVLSIQQNENANVENVIAEGYKLLGVPYVYGAVRLHDGNGKLLSGFSAQKFDCSSLMQYIFYKGANTLLQVNTRTQVKQGKYVARGNLQRGDCIFFTNDSRQHLSGVERIGHVALYLGDNYILHTASDYARIEQISAKRWSYYIEARRFV